VRLRLSLPYVARSGNDLDGLAKMSGDRTGVSRRGGVRDRRAPAPLTPVTPKFSASPLRREFVEDFRHKILASGVHKGSAASRPEGESKSLCRLHLALCHAQPF
jgi:hypothetical protein